MRSHNLLFLKLLWRHVWIFFVPRLSTTVEIMNAHRHWYREVYVIQNFCWLHMAVMHTDNLWRIIKGSSSPRRIQMQASVNNACFIWWLIAKKTPQDACNPGSSGKEKSVLPHFPCLYIHAWLIKFKSSCICCCVSWYTTSYSLHHLPSRSYILTTASAAIILFPFSYYEESHHIFILTAGNLISFPFYDQLIHYCHMIVVFFDSHLPHQDYTQG